MLAYRLFFLFSRFYPQWGSVSLCIPSNEQVCYHGKYLDACIGIRRPGVCGALPYAHLT